jgi:hypothetical protein
MKIKYSHTLIAAALVCAVAASTAQAQQLPTSDIVISRLGNLELKNGYPTDESVKKLYDDIDFQRATKAYLSKQ